MVDSKPRPGAEVPAHVTTALVHAVGLDPRTACVIVLGIDPTTCDNEGRANKGDKVQVTFFHRMAPELTPAGRLGILMALAKQLEEMAGQCVVEVAMDPESSLRGDDEGSSAMRTYETRGPVS